MNLRCIRPASPPGCFHPLRRLLKAALIVAPTGKEAKSPLEGSEVQLAEHAGGDHQVEAATLWSRGGLKLLRDAGHALDQELLGRSGPPVLAEAFVDGLVERAGQAQHVSHLRVDALTLLGRERCFFHTVLEAIGVDVGEDESIAPLEQSR